VFFKNKLCYVAIVMDLDYNDYNLLKNGGYLESSYSTHFEHIKAVYGTEISHSIR
jgi:hypothetical protein